MIERKNPLTSFNDRCICVSDDILEPQILNPKEPKLYFKGFVIEIMEVTSKWSYGIEFGLTNTNPNSLLQSDIQNLLDTPFCFFFCFF